MLDTWLVGATAKWPIQWAPGMVEISVPRKCPASPSVGLGWWRRCCTTVSPTPTTCCAPRPVGSPDVPHGRCLICRFASSGLCFYFPFSLSSPFGHDELTSFEKGLDAFSSYLVKICFFSGVSLGWGRALWTCFCWFEGYYRSSLAAGVRGYGAGYNTVKLTWEALRIVQESWSMGWCPWYVDVIGLKDSKGLWDFTSSLGLPQSLFQDFGPFLQSLKSKPYSNPQDLLSPKPGSNNSMDGQASSPATPAAKRRKPTWCPSSTGPRPPKPTGSRRAGELSFCNLVRSLVGGAAGRLGLICFKLLIGFGEPVWL